MEEHADADASEDAYAKMNVIADAAAEKEKKNAVDRNRLFTANLKYVKALFRICHQS